MTVAVERKGTRLLALATLLAAAFVVLGARLVDLQVLRQESLSRLAANNTKRRVLLGPKRGDLLDARGSVLATSKVVYTVTADPTVIKTNYLRVAQAIAPVLQLEVETVARQLNFPMITKKDGSEVPDRYVVLKHLVDEDTWKRVKAAMTNITFGNEKLLPKRVQNDYDFMRTKSLSGEPDQLRIYPNGQLAAHVLGYVGVGAVSTNATVAVRSTGLAGMELALNKALSGVYGWRKTETDKRAREVVVFREQEVEPQPGLNAVLTVDSRIQMIVEEELAVAVAKHTPVGACIVAVRPRTGEVLALASWPTFDPNSFTKVPDENRFNRVISQVYEPGSTFKIVVVSGALNQGASLSRVFSCDHGQTIFAGRTLHDHGSHGDLTIEDIIAKSSNIGAFKVGYEYLHNEGLYHYIKEFGMGQKTGLGLPGEASGIVHPLTNWQEVSISRVTMGHEIAVTPMQIVMAMSAIANKGVLMKPMLVSRLEDDHGATAVTYEPQMVRRVISESASRSMLQALKKVVTTNGTAIKAAIPGYTVAGKTGTAEKAGRDPRTGKAGYLPGKFYTSFVGFFPADEPEVCMIVMFDEPKHGHFGGDVAAPVFRRIGEKVAQYLAIPPDVEVVPRLASSGGAR